MEISNNLYSSELIESSSNQDYYPFYPFTNQQNEGEQNQEHQIKGNQNQEHQFMENSNNEIIWNNYADDDENNELYFN